MNNLSESIGTIIAAVLLIAFAALLMAFPTKWLWNSCLVPTVDGIHQIGFLQALGLNFLFSILFKPTSKTSKNDK
jgi:predicted acyltransferase